MNPLILIGLAITGLGLFANSKSEKEIKVDTVANSVPNSESEPGKVETIDPGLIPTLIDEVALNDKPDNDETSDG